MRRLVSLFVSVALLVVSSVPLVSANACEMPVPAQAARHAVPTHTIALQSPAMHAGHCHCAAPAGDWQHCCIECGCGCHRSLDTLPHLLAPHSADSGARSGIVASERAATVASVRPPVRELVVISPPPDFS
ncbi:MAG TPA: hypothetical protein VNI58_10850 [Mariprofundaceae bacterium]|nr:hypothetical protein [Mariprofundaceae bacterium]